MRSKVTPLPATVAVIESPDLKINSSSLVSDTEPALDDESPNCSVPPALLSTYALIDCCVASAVALLEDKLSSSKIFVTAVPPVNDNDPVTINPSLTVTEVESEDEIVFTSMDLPRLICKVELEESPAAPDVVMFVPSPTMRNSSFAAKSTVITLESSPLNCSVFVETTRSQTLPVYSQVLSAIVCLSPTLGFVGKLAGIHVFKRN